MAEPKPDAATLQDDPFEVLGLEKTATDDEIKAAHRKLALKCGTLELPARLGSPCLRCPTAD